VFALHETTRRTVCRVAFVAICVVPTVAVLAWATHARSPSRAAEVELELAAACELAVSIEAIDYPRPGVVVYSGIAFSDAETRRVVAEVRTLEATRLAEGIALSAPEAELDGTDLDRWWRVVDRLLRIRRAAGQPPLRLAIQRLTLHDQGRDAITLANIAGQLNCGDETSRAGLRFSLPGGEPREPALLVVQRSHGADPSLTRMELRTGGAPLPLAVARTVFPSLDHLGDRATFTGQLWASTADRGGVDWTGELTGRLANVDLDALVTRQFPHKLSGDAEITLAKLTFAEGRLNRLVGRLDAGSGVVGRSLVEAAAASLGMRTASGGDDRDLVAYEQLAMTFAVDGRDARIEGTCVAASPASGGAEMARCVLRDSFGPMLLQAESQPQPALGILRMLVPESDLQVPASRQTDWMLRRMPIPSADISAAHASPRGALRNAIPSDAR
jgi:hypothetical protein